MKGAIVGEKSKWQVRNRASEISQNMLQKSVLIKRTERTDWKILGKEGYSDLYFDDIVLAEMQRMYLQRRNRMCVQIEQLKVKGCKGDITVTGILKYAVEVEQKCLSSNYNKTFDGLG